jgi:hypothetical protein
LLYSLPFVRISRYPARFVVLAMLALALLAALGARGLLETLDVDRHRSKKERPDLRTSASSALSASLVLATLIGLVLFDNLPQLPMVGIYIPTIYAELSRDAEPYGILEAPFFYRHSPSYMLYQTVHKKGLVGGYISRTMPYPLLEQIPLVRVFAYAQELPDIVAQDPHAIASSVFSYFNIRYLMLHSTGGALRYNDLLPIAQAAAGGVPPRPVDWLLVYRVAPPTEPLPFLGLGAGWSAPEPQNNGGAVRRIAGPAELFIYSALPRRATLELQLRGAGRLHVSVEGRALVPLEEEAGQEKLRIQLEVPQGHMRLLLEPEEGGVVVESVDLQTAGSAGSHSGSR